MKPTHWAMLAMGCAALLGATGQLLIKKANMQFDWSMLTNFWLFGGVACYGIGFLINVLAYRYGTASTLYPIIALSYIFVIILAGIFLGEKITALKVGGALTIIAGVVMVTV